MENRINIGVAKIGLNMDSIPSDITGGQVTYSLNSNIENFDGNTISYSNDTSNIECITFPEGYKVIGVKNITSINRVLFWLTNPTTGDSQIGYSDNGECIYNTLISDEGQECKMGFSILYPIHKSVIKTTNCSTQVYWPDGLNPRRYVDFDDLPWKEIEDPNNDYKKIKQVGQLDCNKLNVQPDFSIPEIVANEVAIGGSLKMGTYQFAVAYSNDNGDTYTSYYNVTNPVSIFENIISPDFNLPTSKAIEITIFDIDITGLYEYFNIAVIKTVNDITTVDLVATLPTSAANLNNEGRTSYTYTYTGGEVSPIQLDITDIFLKFPYYDIAGDITEVDNVLVWSDLKKEDTLNYQSIWARVKLQWETYKIPYNQFEGYSNGINSEKYRGYMRDEVYAFEGCFVLKNGKQTQSFHIPGRIANPIDREIISTSNLDNAFSTISDCEAPVPKQRWQVYNTGSVIDKTQDYKNKAVEDNCYEGSYEYGDFAYWESGEVYPNNIDIWGDLRNTPIRHHKFPDILISPIHTQNDTQDDPNNIRPYKEFEYSIFPIGVKIDLDSLYDAIENSNLTRDQKDSIAGFKIVRGNRAANKSVIAKGLLNNVGKSTYDGQDYYYPNYPYNDINADPYYVTSRLDRVAEDNLTNGLPLGYNPSFSLKGFSADSDYRQRFTFHSPDTHFYQPSLSNTGQYLKLEASIYGKSYGHFVSVEDNAMYKFLTPDVLKAAGGVAIGSTITIGAGQFGSPTLNSASAGPTFTAVNEIFEKITPFTNFGYTYHSFGVYGNYSPVPNEYGDPDRTIGYKNRSIDFIKYVNDGANGIEEGNTLNNFNREGSVYIHITSPLNNAHTSGVNSVPEDNSRYTLASVGDGQAPEYVREKNIAAYYGAIKRDLPRQWGRLYSYETIDTGYYEALYTNGIRKINAPAIFGGDIFINRFAYKSKLPIFRRNTVGNPNGADIEYNSIGNLNYPMFWISTKPANYNIDIQKQVDNVIRQVDPSQGTVFGAIFRVISNVSLGGANGAKDVQNLIIALFKEIYEKIGIKNVNLDRQTIVGLTEQGIMYLFVYGIPYFFCESEVNVDYRQASNELEGNFYPNVSSDIPDDWLQEKNVPIINDNTYTYNRSFSKQNKENLFTHLREDFDPTKLCTTDFPNRAIWSDKSSQEEIKNNWLIYRPSAYYDFPKSNGKLISLDKLQDIEVLARFENKAQKYNALTTVQVSEGPQGYLGNPRLFSGTPAVDIADTDNGYAGSQNKFLLRTEFGHVFIDAKRGQVILLAGGAKNIAFQGMNKWFSENLPFNILEYSTDADIDNHFNGIGLHGVYDQFYQRILITKKDYIPRNNVVIFGQRAYYDPTFLDNKAKNIVFTDNTIEVTIGDPQYFIDKSWTLSYSFRTNAWVSFHSFVPNYYIAYPNYFQSGLNDDNSSLWSHNKTFTSFQSYYGIQNPFIVEYPFNYNIKDEILQSVSNYSNARKYIDFTSFYEPDETIFFNKAIIYNNQQCSGILNLIPKPTKNLSSVMGYPKFNAESKDILTTKRDNIYYFNTFWDITKDKSQPTFLTTEDFTKEEKELNQSNMDYTKMSFKKAPLRAKNTKVRLILDNRSDIKLITQFSITETTPSYI